MFYYLKGRFWHSAEEFVAMARDRTIPVAQTLDGIMTLTEIHEGKTPATAYATGLGGRVRVVKASSTFTGAGAERAAFVSDALRRIVDGHMHDGSETAI